MNIFGIGLPEMAVIAAIGLLVFGPKRLPELGKTLGRTLRGFQSASQEFEQELRSAISSAEVSTMAVAADPGDSQANPAPPAGADLAAMRLASPTAVNITAVSPSPSASDPGPAAQAAIPVAASHQPAEPVG